MKERISDAVIARMPLYYRHLCALEEEGLTRISSQQLGERTGLTASQIRQDVNCFGTFGQQGYGYPVPGLRRHVEHILGMTRAYRMVILGAGNIGRAISHYAPFQKMGFSVEALFDINPPGKSLPEPEKPILPMASLPEYLAAHPIDIGVISVPAAAAQSACDALVSGGVGAIWNFAPVELSVPDHVIVKSVHLMDALLILSFHMSDR